MKRYVYTLTSKTTEAACVLTSEIARVARQLGETPGSWNRIPSDTLLETSALESGETAVQRHDALENYGRYLTALAANHPGVSLPRLRELGLLEDRPFA